MELARAVSPHASGPSSGGDATAVAVHGPSGLGAERTDVVTPEHCGCGFGRGCGFGSVGAGVGFECGVGAGVGKTGRALDGVTPCL